MRIVRIVDQLANAGEHIVAEIEEALRGSVGASSASTGRHRVAASAGASMSATSARGRPRDGGRLEGSRRNEHVGAREAEVRRRVDERVGAETANSSEAAAGKVTAEGQRACRSGERQREQLQMPSARPRGPPPDSRRDGALRSLLVAE